MLHSEESGTSTYENQQLLRRDLVLCFLQHATRLHAGTGWPGAHGAEMEISYERADVDDEGRVYSAASAR